MRSIHLLTPGLPGILVQPTADWMRQAVHLYGDDGNLIGEQIGSVECYDRGKQWKGFTRHGALPFRARGPTALTSFGNGEAAALDELEPHQPPVAPGEADYVGAAGLRHRLGAEVPGAPVLRAVLLRRPLHRPRDGRLGSPSKLHCVRMLDAGVTGPCVPAQQCAAHGRRHYAPALLHPRAVARRAAAVQSGITACGLSRPRKPRRRATSSRSLRTMLSHMASGPG